MNMMSILQFPLLFLAIASFIACSNCFARGNESVLGKRKSEVTTNKPPRSFSGRLTPREGLDLSYANIIENTGKTELSTAELESVILSVIHEFENVQNIRLTYLGNLLTPTVLEKIVSRFPNILELDLRGTQLSKAHAAVVSRLSTLAQLSLSVDPNTLEFLDALPGENLIQSIRFYGSDSSYQLSMETIHALKKFDCLNELQFIRIDITDASNQILNDFRQLKSIIWTARNLIEAEPVFSEFSTLPNLVNLAINDMLMNSFKKVTPYFLRLQTLHIHGLLMSTEEFLVVEHLFGLKKLTLQGIHAKASGRRFFEIVAQLPHLENLNLVSASADSLGAGIESEPERKQAQGVHAYEYYRGFVRMIRELRASKTPISVLSYSHKYIEKLLPDQPLKSQYADLYQKMTKLRFLRVTDNSHQIEPIDRE
jgi:hypothetical protein